MNSPSKPITSGRREADRYHPRAAIAYAMVGILGLALLLHVAPGGPAAGGLLLLTGCVGLVWELRRIYLADQARRAREAAAAARSRIQVKRRARLQQERQERQARQHAEKAARLRQAAALHAAREAQQQRRQQETIAKSLRSQQMESAATRIRAATDNELHAEVFQLFNKRGMVVEVANLETPGDLRLASALYPRGALARCVPVERVAGVVDVQALEAWRRDASAEHAFLIALAGFSPAAVRMAQHLPITLVEAHLLASWSLADS